MPVTVKLPSFDPPYSRVELLVSDALASEIATYVLGTNPQTRSMETMQRQVIIWRRRVREEAKAAAAATPGPAVASSDKDALEKIAQIEIDWLREACLLRVRDRMGYRLIAERTGKAKTSVRRHVPATLEALGIPNPDLLSEESAA